MSPELVVVLAGREIGRVLRDNRGRLTFVYAEDWRQTRGAYPLSLSMPLAAAEHGHKPVEAFLWNVLPDNEAVLARWGQRFQVSPRNPFALLSHVGEDCAGAVQFILPDGLDAVIGAGPATVEWLEDKDIAQRLRALREDRTSWRRPRFSTRTVDGAYRQAGRRQPISSSRRPAHSTAMPRTSISACGLLQRLA
jgi:serine/threonine-protein kinase HipA